MEPCTTAFRILTDASTGVRMATIESVTTREADGAVVGCLTLLESLIEGEARDLVAKLTAWLDAPRLAARETAEAVSRDGSGDASVRLLRTPFEWGTSDEDGMSIWYTGPDAERRARRDYAESRGKALCVCGAECDADEIDRSGDEPQCPACVAAAVEAFNAQRFACSNRGNGYAEACGWAGTGADLDEVDTGNSIEPGCPKCSGVVEEISK